MRVAVQGCCHGEMDAIYATLAAAEQRTGQKTDLLLCCGDFHSLRGAGDLDCIAVPAKYKQLGDFHKYYSGEREAPCLTIFIGGNHEASNYLQELGFGGWVAPNIYYLGYCGAVRVGHLRISGLSGIFKRHDYPLGHFEAPPYDRSTLRSVYHVRRHDVWKLQQLGGVEDGVTDVMMSHDWPRGIARCGNTEELLRRKSFLRDEVNDNSLGSAPGEELLNALRPAYWFAAHLHVKFPALVAHRLGRPRPAAPAGASDPPPGAEGSQTKFLALGKCLPGHDFLQILEMPAPEAGAAAAEGGAAGGGSPVLRYDRRWLAVTKAAAPYFHVGRSAFRPPQEHALREQLSAAEAFVAAAHPTEESLVVPTNFVIPAAPYAVNGQTEAMLGALGLDAAATLQGRAPQPGQQQAAQQPAATLDGLKSQAAKRRRELEAEEANAPTGGMLDGEIDLD